MRKRLGPTIQEVSENDIGHADRYKAVHGYSPTKDNYATTLVAFGPGVKKNVTIPKARLVDEGPTFLKLLDLPPFPTKTSGKVITGLFD